MAERQHRLINDPETIQSGINPSIHPLQATMWVDGRNVLFEEGTVKTVKGAAELDSLDLVDSKGGEEYGQGGFGEGPYGGEALKSNSTLRGLSQILRSDGQNFFFGDQSRLFRWRPGPGIEVIGSSYNGIIDETVNDPASAWSFVPWFDWMLATNGQDKPQIWKDLPSNGSFTEIADFVEDSTEIFVKKGQHVLAFNIPPAGRQNFAWCDAGDPETWTPKSDNAAGSLPISDLDSGIMAAANLGDRIAVYGDNAMHLVRYTGTPFFFGQQKALTGIGCVGKMALAARSREHFGVSIKGIWRTDGTSFQYIDKPAIRRWLRENVNWDQASKVSARVIEEESRVEFYFPTGTNKEPDTGWSYNFRTGAWTRFNFGYTSVVERRVINNGVAVTENGKLLRLDDAQSKVVQRVISRPIEFEEGLRRVLLDRVAPQLSYQLGEAPKLYWRAGDQPDLSSRSWTELATLDTSGELISAQGKRLEGAYHQFKIEKAAGNNASWSFAGLGLRVVPTGRSER